MTTRARSENRPKIGRAVLPDRLPRASVLQTMRGLWKTASAEATLLEADGYPVHAGAWRELASILEPIGAAVRAAIERQDAEPGILAERERCSAAMVRHGGLPPATPEPAETAPEIPA